LLEVIVAISSVHLITFTINLRHVEGEILIIYVRYTFDYSHRSAFAIKIRCQCMNLCPLI